MPTPRKSALMLRTEKKTHISKRELATREAGEAATLSGVRLKARADVQKDQEARRILRDARRQLEAMGKSDDLYAGSINDYALLCAEQIRQARRVGQIRKHLEQIREAYAAGDLTARQAAELEAKAERTLDRAEANALRIISAKLEIAKRNLMTMDSAGRVVPPARQETAKDRLTNILKL